MERRYQLLVVVVLCLVGVGANVQYASTDFRPYPEYDDIISDPAGADGKQAFLFVEVESVNEQAGEMSVRLEEQEVVDFGLAGPTKVTTARHELTVRPADPSVLDTVKPGSSIQVYGTLQDGSTVLVAESSVVDYRGWEDWRYVFGTSLLGALVAGAYFFRHWRIDWRELCFQRRGDS